MTDQSEIFRRPASREPIPIHLHSRLGTAVAKSLAKKVRNHGGNPEADEDEAEVIICRLYGPAFSMLTKKYEHARYKWVEAPSWVDHCIHENCYVHPIRPPVLKAHKEGRTPYTPEDDRHIVEFLAKRIPYGNMKGRKGQTLWKDLCDRADLYPWAEKHTWQSWRERYVKNDKLFDAKIEKVVLKDPDRPEVGGKGQYRVNYGKPDPRNRPQFSDIRCAVEEEEELDIEELLVRKRRAPEPAASSSKRRRTGRRSEEEEEEEEEQQQQEQHRRGALGLNYTVDTDIQRPSNRIPEVVIETNAVITPPAEQVIAPLFPTVSETEQPLQSQSQLPPKPRPKPRRTTKSTDVPQDATQVPSNKDAPPTRTRSRSKPPTGVIEPFQAVKPQSTQSARTRTTRIVAAATAPSPPPSLLPPPPPPTLASQPRLVSETRSKARILSNELPAWETMRGEDEDGPEDYRGDDDVHVHDNSESDSDFSNISAMRQLNEGMRAIREQTMKEFPDKGIGAATFSIFSELGKS